MMAPFAPVQAGLAHRPARMGERLGRYLQAVLHEPLALGGEFDRLLAVADQPLPFHAVEHLHAKIARQMVIADPRAVSARPVISAVSMLDRAGSPTSAATMAISGPAFIVR